MARTRAPLLRDLGWRLEALAFDAASAVARLFPLEWVSAAGGALGRWLGPLTRAHKVAARNIEIAFPDLTPEARAALLRDQWDNTGRTFFEFPFMDRITPASGRVEVVGRERLVALAREKRPAVLISGHFANWEVMAACIVDSGLDCQITYRAANNPYVDRRIKEGRARYGVRLFAPKGSDGSRELLAALAKGEAVAFLNDQKFNGGVAAPFFGRPAHTAFASTRLALRFDAVMQPMVVERLPGARFRVIVPEPIRLQNTGDRERDLRAGVEKINAFVEAQVRRRPAEWFWVHRRWPKEVYRAPEPVPAASASA